MSRETISKITDRVLDDMAEWVNRPLDRVYRLFGFQWGVMVASRSQLGRPA